MPGSHDIGSITLMSPTHPPPAPSADSDLTIEVGDRTWSPADYMRLLNIGTAKCVAVTIVLILGVYHSVLHATYGVTPCKGLLKHGMYKGSQWQPWGCMMHHYSRTDTERCFRYNRFWGGQNHLVFIGDTRVRQLYLAMRRWVELGADPGLLMTATPTNDGWARGYDLSWENSAQNLKLDYYWSPVVNNSMMELLDTWRTGRGPTVLVIGAGAASIKISNNSLVTLDEHRRNLTRVRVELENMVEYGGSKVLWAMEPPVNWERLNDSNKMLTNDAISIYNSEANRVFHESKVTIWTSLFSLAEGTMDHMKDGFHLSPLALSKATQMVLNLVCNDNMNFNDGSCCKSSDRPTSLQVIAFSVLGVGLCLSLVVILYEMVCKRHPSHQYQNYRYRLLPRPGTIIENFEVDGFNSFIGQLWQCNLPVNKVTNFIFCVAKLSIIVSYFYICDRTNFFMKENKYFTPINFWLPVLYVTVVGIFFSEESSYTVIMHQDQTDEWRGWMMMIILVYHYTGASQSVPIYMHIRLCISMHLFLLGYTHFTYAWQKGRTGIIRLMQVLFKMNFLTFVLCICMNRPYQFYYFVPLVSFWYLVFFFILNCPPVLAIQDSLSVNSQLSHYLYTVLKFAGLLALVSMFYLSQVFFEKIFVTRPWKALFVTTDDDIHEWWFRWKLDRYSIAAGGIFALVTLVGGRMKLYDDSNHGSLWPKSISIPVSLAAVLGLASYTFFALLCRNKMDCNEVHPYISFLPIVSFTLLRNMTGFVRSRYSSFFAWIGRLYIEMLIAQYHIFLSADTSGVLVLIPNYPVINVLLTTFIFICACHEIHSLTEQLLPYFVPSEPLLVLRNIVIFILVLLPIGIHDGMF